MCNININMHTTRAKYLLSVKRLTIRNELIPKHNVDKKRITHRLNFIEELIRAPEAEAKAVLKDRVAAEREGEGARGECGEKSGGCQESRV